MAKKLLVKKIAGCVVLQAEPEWLRVQLQEKNGRIPNLVKEVRRVIITEGFALVSRKEFRQQCRKIIGFGVDQPTTFVCLAVGRLSEKKEAKFPALYLEPSGWQDRSSLSSGNWPHEALFVVKEY